MDHLGHLGHLGHLAAWPGLASPAHLPVVLAARKPTGQSRAPRLPRGGSRRGNHPHMMAGVRFVDVEAEELTLRGMVCMRHQEPIFRGRKPCFHERVDAPATCTFYVVGCWLVRIPM